MKQLIMAAGLAVMLTACGTSEKKTVEGENPFFAEYTTPFGVPPFDPNQVRALQTGPIARHGRGTQGDRGDRE